MLGDVFLGEGMRKKLLLVLSGMTLLAGLAGSATQVVAAPPPPPLVAVILPRDNARFQSMHTAFLKAFASVTTVAGKPRLYVQSPNPDIMSLRNSIRKATAIGADLIVVYGTRAATAARQEDFTEPLIFADVFEPVAMGLVPSLQHGGNLVTGVCGYAPVQTLFKFFQETFGAGRLGTLTESRYPSAKVQVELLHNMVCRHGDPVGSADRALPPAVPCRLAAVSTDMQVAQGVTQAIKQLEGEIDVIYLSDLLPTDRQADELLAYATRAGLPVISQRYGAADQGALMTLEADPVEQGEKLAEIARRVIDGELPEDIPPLIPRRVSLIINLAIARQLGIDVPFTVLTQTTRVVQTLPAVVESQPSR
jgi:putative ABC transport system substrate-binding protein